MSNLLNSFKEKLNTFTPEGTGIREEIQPRATKGMVVGAGKMETNGTTQNARIFDTSDDINVFRGIKLKEDGGGYISTIISCLEQGQLAVVDFSESEELDKELQFHVLLGATIALDGTYKILDKARNLVLFTSSKKKIGETRYSLENNKK